MGWKICNFKWMIKGNPNCSHSSNLRNARRFLYILAQMKYFNTSNLTCLTTNLASSSLESHNMSSKQIDEFWRVKRSCGLLYPSKNRINHWHWAVLIVVGTPLCVFVLLLRIIYYVLIKNLSQPTPISAIYYAVRHIFISYNVHIHLYNIFHQF